MRDPSSVYCGSLENVKHHIGIEANNGAYSIIVFNDNKWDGTWNLYRTSGKDGKHLWLVNIEKCLLNSSRSLRFQDDSEISLLKSKCNEIHAEFALINSGYLCNDFPYEKRGAVCVLGDKTIIHASILLESDWEHQIDSLKASMVDRES